MNAIYQSHGVKFRYPSDWELSEQQSEEQFSITVSSPLTAFWTLSLFPDCPEPDDIVHTVLDVFREEYSEMDEYPAKVRLDQRPTVARDIDFVCLDVLNFASVRACRTPGFTVMVLFQLTEAERDETGPILDKITRSLSFPSQSSEEEIEPDEG